MRALSLFRLDASTREEGSTSRALADVVENRWREAVPDTPVTRRHTGVQPLPSDAWAAAVAASTTPEAERTAARPPWSTWPGSWSMSGRRASRRAG